MEDDVLSVVVKDKDNHILELYEASNMEMHEDYYRWLVACGWDK